MPISKHKKNGTMQNPDERKAKINTPPVPKGKISNHKKRGLMEDGDEVKSKRNSVTP